MTVATKVRLELPDIATRLKRTRLPEVDAVVGIATGGTVLASLVAYELERPLKLIRLNYRAPDNTPQRPWPELLEPFELDATMRRVLLVDDVSVSGQTLRQAQRYLDGLDVTTLVFKGRADIVLYPEVSTCIELPWRDG
ncbi:hypothetical protein BH24DEI2_BH24DEI2_20960 [soil metagenome]